MNTTPLTSAALAGLMQPMLGTVNMVIAPVVAQGARHQGATKCAQTSAAPMKPRSA